MMKARPEVERLTKEILELGARDPERSKTLCKILVGLEPERNSIERSLSYTALAIGYAEASEFEEALRYAQLALSEGENTHNDSLRERALQVFGFIYEKNFDFKRGLEFTSAAAELARKHDDKIRLGLDLMQINRLARRLQRYQLAFEVVLEAKTIYSELGDIQHVAFSTGNLGGTLHDVGLNDEAIAAFQEELPIAQMTGNKKETAGCLCNIGRVYSLQSFHAEAYDYFCQAYAVIKEINEVDFRLRILGNLVKVCIKLNLLDEAEHYLRERENIPGKFLSSEEILQTGYLWAKIQLTRGNPILAVEYLLNVAKYYGAGEVGYNFAYAEVCGIAYASAGKYEEAYNWQIKAHKLYEEVSDEERKGLRFYEEELRKRLEEKQSKIMTLKDSEVANTTLHLLSQTEILSELRSDLLTMIRRIPPTDPVAKELRERIRNLPCKSIDWEKFDVQFKAAHPEFTKKLLEMYTNLTGMESRICSLIRMNLKSEEIARLFCLSDRTVENHRKHIREKMKLKREVDLAIHLSKI